MSDNFKVTLSRDRADDPLLIQWPNGGNGSVVFVRPSNSNPESPSGAELIGWIRGGDVTLDASSLPVGVFGSTPHVTVRNYKDMTGTNRVLKVEREGSASTLTPPIVDDKSERPTTSNDDDGDAPPEAKRQKIDDQIPEASSSADSMEPSLSRLLDSDQSNHAEESYSTSINSKASTIDVPPTSPSQNSERSFAEVADNESETRMTDGVGVGEKQVQVNTRSYQCNMLTIANADKEDVETLAGPGIPTNGGGSPPEMELVSSPIIRELSTPLGIQQSGEVSGVTSQAVLPLKDGNSPLQTETAADAIGSDNGQNENSSEFERQVFRGLQELISVVKWTVQGIAVNSIMKDDRSRLMATVNWSLGQGQQPPDKWLLRAQNLSMTLNDDWKYHEFLYVLSDKSDFELPLWLKCGNRYKVTVRGLVTADSRPPHHESSSVSQSSGDDAQQSAADDAATTDWFRVTHRGSVEFRAGPLLERSEVKDLLKKARDFVNDLDCDYTSCDKMTRVQDQSYFDRISNGDGIMRAHLKDPTGDRRSPINGEIRGLFFSTNLRGSGRYSPYGNRRISIDSSVLFGRAPRIYFADFYCLNNGRDHYVTFVMTKWGSDATRFCEEHLVYMDNKHDVFFTWNEKQLLFEVLDSADGEDGKRCFIEMFFTDDLDVRAMLDSLERVNPSYHGSTSQGGKKKTYSCQVCWLFGNRMADREPGLDDL